MLLGEILVVELLVVVELIIEAKAIPNKGSNIYENICR